MDQPFNRQRPSGSSRDLELYTIPVVVHVVWQEEAQNVSDEAIADVIDVLNEDYRRLNADADQVRTEFADVVGDPFIQFELAGVERVSTTATFELDLLGGSLPDNVKNGAEGGSDAWDTEHYLNIWVCNIEGGGLLGYAYPPADLENWPEGANAPSPELDGVVIHHEVFRRTGTYTTTGLLGGEEVTIPVRGRTVTHEIGHYLGLRHIWGDGLLSILGIPDCDADDGVADTPNQGASSQFACDPEQNSCTDEVDDKPDMFENYMDYASEDCLNSFTQGQIAIMRSVLENERIGLIEQMVSSSEPVVNSDHLQLFPNPVADQLTISWRVEPTEELSYRLLDMQGRQLMMWERGPEWQGQISLANLAAGVYSLVIEGSDQIWVERLVKR